MAGTPAPAGGINSSSNPRYPGRAGDPGKRYTLWFHGILFEAAGHRRLARLWREMRHELELWLALLHRDHHQQTNRTRSQTADSHAELLECFRTGPPTAAERLMRAHILGWREWLPHHNLDAPTHGHPALS